MPRAIRRRRPAFAASDNVAWRQSEAKTRSGHLVVAGIGRNVPVRAGPAIARGHSSQYRSVASIAQGLDRTLRIANPYRVSRGRKLADLTLRGVRGPPELRPSLLRHRLPASRLRVSSTWCWEIMAMTAFVDREDEIEALEELWGSRFQLALLWGRRRVGKTRLLDEFAAGKPVITFQADEGTATEQLARLTDRILAYRNDAALRAQPISNWDAAIATILRLARDAKRDAHQL